MPASPFQPLALAVAQPSCVAHDVVANARAHAALVRAAGALRRRAGPAGRRGRRVAAGPGGVP